MPQPIQSLQTSQSRCTKWLWVATVQTDWSENVKMKQARKEKKALLRQSANLFPCNVCMDSGNAAIFCHNEWSHWSQSTGCDDKHQTNSGEAYKTREEAH